MQLGTGIRYVFGLEGQAAFMIGIMLAIQTGSQPSSNRPWSHWSAMWLSTDTNLMGPPKTKEKAPAIPSGESRSDCWFKRMSGNGQGGISTREIGAAEGAQCSRDTWRIEFELEPSSHCTTDRKGRLPTQGWSSKTSPSANLVLP